ncbi:MAG: hypothetical protein J6Y20_03685 [Lachnospiraceae bacterium]|nr:hypothetical protein [Lachnospiraceae bacterium]
MKKLLSLILTLALLLSIPCSAYATITERKSKEAERFLWDELSVYSPTDQITAAVLAYFWRESQYRSDAVAGWGNSLHGYGIDLCEKVTERTDKGLEDGSSRDYFLKACRKYGGYGLGQWQSPSKVEALYDFAVGYGGSIGDAELQCAFVFDNLENGYPRLWKRLKKCKSAEKAGRLLAIYYDGTKEGMYYIGYKAKQFYEKYGGDA